jgi:IS30 family transposase
MSAKKHIDIDLVRQLASEGWTRPEIEEHIGVCRKVVSREMKANNIHTYGNRRNTFGNLQGLKPPAAVKPRIAAKKEPAANNPLWTAWTAWRA